MSKFQVGDRIISYNYKGKEIGTVRALFGEFLEYNADHPTQIPTGFNSVRAHQKQCRKLVKKQLRRVWVLFGEDGGPDDVSSMRQIGDTWIECVEVRSKKK